MGRLLEGYAVQKAPVETSPYPELHPNIAVTSGRTRLLEIPGCHLQKVAGPAAFKGLFLSEKPVWCQPHAHGGEVAGCSRSLEMAMSPCVTQL